MVRATLPQSIAVQWDEVIAVDQNGIITMYEVRYEPLETFGGQIQTQTMNVTAPMMSVNLRDLEEFIVYNISVRAYTNVGEGPYSVGRSVITHSDGKKFQSHS